jgi:DNA end-binding protein Ku
MASTIWRGYISFGLISIPVRLYRAARAERVSFRRVYRQNATAADSESDDESDAPPIPAKRGREPVAEARLNAGPSLVARAAPRSEPAEEVPHVEAPPVLERVRQAAVRTDTGAVLNNPSVLKGYEYEKGRYVEIDPEELKSAAPKTSSAMEILEFVALSEIDPVYFETSYYVTPEEAGEKAYALLYRALQTSGLVALAQFAMHSREHVVVVRAGQKGILAHTMFFASEVRADDEFRADLNLVSSKELQLAETLINSLATTFDPFKFRDAYRERIEALVARKVQGLPAAPDEAPAARGAEVVDIAEALRRSLANLKKPAASDTAPAPKAKAEPEQKPRTKRAARTREAG